MIKVCKPKLEFEEYGQCIKNMIKLRKTSPSY